MKKSILLFVVVITSLQLFSQEKDSSKQLFIDPPRAHTIVCSTPIIKVQEPEVQMNTVQDLIITLNTNFPGFRGTTTGLFNESPVLTYRNSTVNDIYIDGVRNDVSVLKHINISDIESVQVFNSVMDSNLYSLTSK